MKFNYFKILLKIAMILITYFIIAKFIPIILKASTLFIIDTVIVVILSNYDFLISTFIKKEKKDRKKLFNIYYINYPKAFEICMLINNKRKSKEELSVKDEERRDFSLSLGGSLVNNKPTMIPGISNENVSTKTYEFRELQEIKETNSIYISEIIKKCKSIEEEGVSNGSLVKIDDVKLQIVNKDEIAQINSVLSGIFKDSNISTVSNGQTLNIDINAIGNILLKDYKYSLKGKKENVEFYISIPIKTKKEFENDYSIYDLEVGKVNVIGIYRTDEYEYKNNSTYNYLQEIGEKDLYMEENLLKSNTCNNKKEKRKNNAKKETVYIDVIAIIQDLDITGGPENE